MEEFELEAGEQVIRTVRKHWLVFAGAMIPFAFLAWVPSLFPLVVRFIESLGQVPGSYEAYVSFANPWFRFFLGLWWLLLWTGAFNAFVSYFLNSWIITSKRIVEIRQYGFWSRKVSSFLLEHVQDVTTTTEGIFSDLFNFGHVRVETAGTASAHFEMDGVESPQRMRDLIMREIALLHGENRAP